MLKIDSDNMIIALTRGDTATIVFSAVKDDGTVYTATTDDVLKFAVGKKYGEYIFEVVNEYNDDPSDFWNITIAPEKTEALKFGDYFFDVQLTHNDSGTPEVDTIIGKTDEITPTFRIWGEVAK